jgi:HEAT repeat protein
MKPMSLTLLCLPFLFLLGCRRSDVPQEKYFSGHPVEHWLEALRSPDPKTRKKAADVLGNVGPVDARSVPALIGAVKDPDPKVRDAAVLSLSKIGPPAADAVKVLNDATQDTDPTVRAHASTAVERVRG